MRAITFVLGTTLIRAQSKTLTKTLGLGAIIGFMVACSPSVPDSGAGFDTIEAQRARDAELTTGMPLAAPTVLSEETLAPAAIPTTLPMGAAPPTVVAQPLPQAVSQTAGTGQSADIAAETAAALALASANSGQAPLQASPSNPAPQNQAAISDENDFSAVSSRQSISSDAERIAQNRAQYQVVTPTVLPTRQGTAQPNVVDYALSTSNPRGSKVYSRSGFNGAAKAARNCARYPSPDLAQSAFLAKGGPQKDRQGLDPDGDGYACAWDPAPYRQAAKN